VCCAAALWTAGSMCWGSPLGTTPSCTGSRCVCGGGGAVRVDYMCCRRCSAMQVECSGL
jgi:hypothetical protein